MTVSQPSAQVTGRNYRRWRLPVAAAAIISVAAILTMLVVTSWGQRHTATPLGTSRTKAPTQSIVTTAATTATAGYTATPQVNLAPVDTSGHAVSGYTVVSGNVDSVDCSGGQASPAALSPNIYFCAPTAAGADACWPEADGLHVLCLRDPAPPLGPCRSGRRAVLLSRE
jgi:hypothetical protein